MKLRRVFVTAAVLVLHAVAAYAENVVVSTSAHILEGDIGRAREISIRRAITRAVESKGATVNSQTIVASNSVSDTTQIRSSACTGDVRVISQNIRGDEISVTVSVDVLPNGCELSCNKRHVNRIIATDFAFEYPEQLSNEELNILRFKTAAEITKFINKRNSVIALSADMDFPYASAKKAPEPYFDKISGDLLFGKISGTSKAPYVLSGVYRDIGIRLASNQPQRTIQIDAYLHEGYSGKLISSKSFNTTALNEERVSKIYVIGSPEFYGTKFGTHWKKSLDEVADWAVEQSNCLPMVARIARFNAKQITISMGLDSGMSEGDIVYVILSNSNSMMTNKGKFIEEDKKTTLNLLVRSIGVDYIVLEAIDKVDFRVKLQVGDIILIQ